MLSGSSLTGNLSLAPVASEGGFLAVSTNGFLSTDANIFLFDADDLGQTVSDFTPYAFADAVSRNVVSFGEPLVTPDPDTTDEIGSEAASSIALPRTGPAFSEYDLSDSFVQEPSLPTTGEGVLRGDENNDVDGIVEDLLDEPTDDPPGLSGSVAKMLVIDDPIQLVASQLDTDRSDQHKGGTLQVASAVHTTQRAYESQFLASLAHNLNREDVLPTTLPTRAQPVVAELARAVAFETLGQQDAIPTSDIDRVTSGQLQEPTQATPLTLEPVSAQLHVVPVQSRLINDSTSNEMKTRTSQSSHRGEDALANLAERVAERVDNEQHAAQIITFAQWPTLATVIAGYLLVERRRPQAAQAVQIPPRRRLVRHKTPAS